MQIKQNANRATNLVKQLLAFSRQQNLQPKIIKLIDVISELSALINRLIGAGIELKIQHEHDLWPIKADEGQLEQVIINLVVNARDAMNGKGKLTIKTANFISERDIPVGHDVMNAGKYVRIDIEDTGEGIEPQNLEHIFEPFFSTKEMGAGTGLGLSTAYGIIKQTGGFIGVKSKIGQGSTFSIYIPPTCEKVTDPQPNKLYNVEDLTGKERILFVEDEDAVRTFSARALRDKGYDVIEAVSGDQALCLIENGSRFDLIITDVVMPKMDGSTLSRRIYALDPDARIIFISGYSEDTFRDQLTKGQVIHFLQKPFNIKELASKVKEVLNTHRTSKQGSGICQIK